MSVLRKLLSPAGFLLALVFFALPFAAVSCEDAELGSVDLSYSGVSLVTGAEPRVEIVDKAGSLGDDTATRPPPPQPDVQPLAGVTIALVLAGIGTALIRPARLRTLAAGAAAALAGLLLVITELVALDRLDTEVARLVGRVETFTDLDVVHTRIGFWLALGALVTVLVTNIAVAARAWVRQ